MNYNVGLPDTIDSYLEVKTIDTSTRTQLSRVLCSFYEFNVHVDLL